MFYNSEYIIRKFKTDQKIAYLTFDDGPDPMLTEKVLLILKKYGIPATFFVIAEKAQRYSEIIKKILDDGHSIGNHSLNHNYRSFFYTFDKMSEWIQKSERAIQNITGKPTIGFRSPAGIVNKQLIRVLQVLKMPLYHWNIRFYDTKFPLNKRKVEKACSDITPGSIILLHDCHKLNQDNFIYQLEQLIIGLLKVDYVFAKIE